ncbi:MAG: hypothetical protein E6713_03495 [Sporomusaceae bacterium]|nr:hypothetical protein [Sporomusaceae bacterium]
MFQRICAKFLVLLAMALFCGQFPVTSAATPAAIFRTGEVHYLATEDGMFGILGDDGIKYQPINLPRQFRKEGAVIAFTATPKDDTFTSIMWGKVVELKNVHSLSPDLPKGERTAIYLLQQRMDAFNEKNLAKLQNVDVESRSLAPAQFMDWIGGYGGFTLRYVEILSADSMSITGYYVYTRGLGKEIRWSDGAEIAASAFELTRRNDGWKLTASGSAIDKIADVAPQDLMKKSKAKYGTDDLSTLWR